MCSGFPWSGKSAEQCRGGQREETPEAVYCSTHPSSAPREKTWLWVLDRPYAWLPEPEVEPGPPVWERPPSRAPSGLRHPDWRPTATWDYRDEHGNYAYSVVRFDWTGLEQHLPSGMRMKDYRPGRRFAPGSDLYRWGLPAEARVPYNLPELLLAIRAGWPVWIAEGEKSADAINYDFSGNNTATTMPGGSNSWGAGTPERWLPADLHAAVIVDRDAAGLGWAKDVRSTLPHATFWQSATLAEGDDVVDHLEAGYSLAELISLELP